MKKKWIASLLALTMVLTLLPGMALAAEGGGTIEPITEVGVVNEDTIVVSDATLNWYPQDDKIGRWQDGWWVGVRIIAPDSVTDKNVANVRYSNAGSANPASNFNDSKDGKTEDGNYYMGAWLPVLPEYLESFINVNQILTWKYTFDWDGNGDVDQTFKIQVDPTNITLLKDSEQVWPVAKIGDKQYASLENAIAAANGDTVTLLKDITSTVTVPSGKTVTIYLNGKNIAVTGGNAIVNKGTLTVQGTGNVTATGSGNAALANFPGASATLNGGTYQSTGWYVIKNLGAVEIDGAVTVAMDNAENTASLIDNGWYYATDKLAGEDVTAQSNSVASLTIKSGAFTGSSGKKSCSVVKNDDYGVLNISGGTFDSTANNGEENATTIMNWNKATISGGTFKGQYPVSNGYCGEHDLGELTISGGDFTGVTNIFGVNGGATNGKGKVTISGGTFTAPNFDGVTPYAIEVTGGKFSSDVSAYVDKANGYEWYSYSGKVAATDHAHRTGVTCDICGYYRAPAPITTTETEKNEDGSTTTTTSNRLTGTKTETTTNTDGSTTVVETKKDGTVTTTEKATDGTETKTVENPDGSSTAVETKTDGTVTTTEKTVDGTVTETVANPDGTSTAVETKADGTVTTTEKDAEGSTTATVQNTDGSTEVSVEKADGTTATATTDETGKTEAEVTLSTTIIETAAENKETVALPIPEVTASADKAEASVITVNTNTETEVKVEIPVADVTDSTVAVIVKADGTEEVIRSTELTENGVAVAVPDGATVKIVDNTKEFSDVDDHWAGKFINFTSARELMNGTDTEAKTFEPDTTTNRAMVAQVLHNMANNPEVTGKEFSDVAEGDWFGSAVAWASEEGIVGGRPDGTFGPNDSIYRQDLVVMLYQYAKKLGADVSASKDLAEFTDGALTDTYAQEAMKWAVGCGLMSGKGNGILDPKGFATRGELATFVMQFYKLVRSQV